LNRKEPTLTAKLAAAIRELFQIPHEHAKLMTDDQVLSLVQWHHIEYHATGGSDEHWNLDPLTIKGHKARTAKIDVPQIAKTKRLTAAQEEFRRTMTTPRDERPPKQSRWGKRPFNRSKKHATTPRSDLR
jgi:hypothetical protein